MTATTAVGVRTCVLFSRDIREQESGIRIICSRLISGKVLRVVFLAVCVVRLSLVHRWVLALWSCLFQALASLVTPLSLCCSE